MTEKEEKNIGIKNEELEDLIAQNFARYGDVYQSLSDRDIERRKHLNKIIDKDFAQYDDVFRALAKWEAENDNQKSEGKSD